MKIRKALFFILILPLLAACTGKKPRMDSETKVSSETPSTKKASAQKPQKQEAESSSYSFDARMAEIAEYNRGPLLAYWGEIEASSQGLEYPAENLIDETWKTWATAENKGIGESFTINFGKGESGKIINYPVTGFALKNGHGHLDYYGKCNRVKSFKIYIDGEYTETIPIKDSISFEQYAFAVPVNCNTVRFEIEEIYPGTEFFSTCVAEAALMAKTVSDKDFYENILFWLGDIHGDFLEEDSQYVNHDKQMIPIADIEKITPLDYLPFDTSWAEKNLFYYDRETKTYPPRKTKIALLGKPTSLSLMDDMPRLDGATAMYPLYSAFVHAVYPRINITEYEGSYEHDYSYLETFLKWAYCPNMSLFSERANRFIKDIEFTSIVQCNTTAKAYQRLIDGETDIIFCYEPSEAGKKAIAEKGKQFHLTPIAKDAFVFIVNEKNKLNNITQQQIRDIYSGRVTNWKSISGIDEPIIAYQRRENSGSQTTFQSIMKDEQIIRPILDGEFVARGMTMMINKVSSDYYNYNAAIGYSFLFYITAMIDNTGVKALSVDGVKPEQRTVQNGTYPFSQTVYAITTGDESENTKKFIEWILSGQGQELVAKTGYIPIK